MSTRTKTSTLTDCVNLLNKMINPYAVVYKGVKVAFTDNVINLIIGQLVLIDYIVMIYWAKRKFRMSLVGQKEKTKYMVR